MHAKWVVCTLSKHGATPALRRGTFPLKSLFKNLNFCLGPVRGERGHDTYTQLAAHFRPLFCIILLTKDKWR